MRCRSSASRASAGDAEGVGGVTVLGLPPARSRGCDGWRDGLRRRFPLDARDARDAAPTARALGESGSGRRSRSRQGRASSRCARRSRRADGSSRRSSSGRSTPDAPTRVDRPCRSLARRHARRARARPAPAEGARGRRGRRARRHGAASGLPMHSAWVGEGGVVPRSAAGGVVLRYRISRRATPASAPVRPPTSRPRRSSSLRGSAILAGGVGGKLALAVGGRQVPVEVAASSIASPARGRGGRRRHRRARDGGQHGGARAGARRTRSGSTCPTPGMTPLRRRSRDRRSAASRRSRAGAVDEARDDPLGHGTFLALDSPRSSRSCSRRSGSRSRCSPICGTTAASSTTSRRRAPRRRCSGGSCASVLSSSASRASSPARSRGPLLALLVTRVVTVTARATTHRLPLQTSFDLRVVGVAAVVYLLVAAALVALATRRAFRSDRGPVRAQASGA